ncbi:hypothetical protein SLS56_005768 [Neofusicoccum ribis]|uniref:Uncharacterized protein n=1 Tax=Neofusicoccum ribis TaxID=45134 RepID=A0ABR3STH3_9PEZI
MVRAYGATCQNCNRKSPLGWVWQCACDEGDDPWTIIATHQSAAAACDPADPISKMKALTLNQSIIDQAESGLYTPEQIERLISQKQQVIHVINSQSPDKAAEDFRAKSQSPSETAVAKERARHMRTVHPRCRYKCCQACRADFRARSFESFDAVFGGEVKPLRPADVANLPVQDAKVMSNIGMSPPLLMTKSSFSTDSGDSEPAESVRTWKTTDSALDFRNRETMQARTFYRVEPMNDMDYMYHNLNDYSFGRNFRSSMSHAVKYVFRKRRDSSSEGSAVTLPVARSIKSSSSKNPQDSGLSLPRSFFSRRNPSTCAVAPSTIIRGGIPTPAPTCSTDDTSSISDADGGVSLTEESAELHMPDLVPQGTMAQA